MLELYKQIKQRIDTIPKIENTVFVANNAVIIGDVTIGEGSSIWYGCTLRGDVNNIIIGKNTNIQDNTVIHVSTRGQGTYIGDGVTVGHMALLHACTIEDKSFIGMQSCIMDNAKIEKYAMVAAGSLVTQGKIVKSGELWAGRPAKYIRDLTDDERNEIDHSAKHYARISEIYRQKED